jgi:hypothetical protein
MKLTKQSEKQVALFKEIIAKSYDKDITTSMALESLIDYGFKQLLEVRPTIKFLNQDSD